MLIIYEANEDLKVGLYKSMLGSVCVYVYKSLCLNSFLDTVFETRQ